MIALLIAAVTTTAPIPQSEPPQTNQQVAVMCFKSGEQQSGMNRICYYNCLGSTVAITIGAIELCPLSIDN